MRRKNRVFLEYVVVGVLTAIFLYFAFGCAAVTPRQALQLGQTIGEHPPRNLIDLSCGDHRGVSEGLAVCEIQKGQTAAAWVKIMPAVGRVVFSDGDRKVPIDFNYRKGGWIWKETIIDRTWVPLDLGALTIFGDKPVAFDVESQTSDGVIINRGLFYVRTCGQGLGPCSDLRYGYECDGGTQTADAGQIGSCVRQAGSSLKLWVPVEGSGYKLRLGARVTVYSATDGWTYRHSISADDLAAGGVKITYPTIRPVPALFSLSAYQWEGKFLTEHHGKLLVAGFNTAWTGIDRPHLVRNADKTIDACIPFRATLLEVSEGSKITTATSDCVRWPAPRDQVCAFAFDRRSSDQTYSCVKAGKETRFPK